MKTYEYYRTRILDASPAAREAYLAEAYQSGRFSPEELDKLSRLAVRRRDA